MPRILADRAGHGRARRRGRADRPALVAIGMGSALLYGYAALALPTSNRPAHVALFLVVFLALFALYLLAVRRVGSARPGGGVMGVVFAFAVLFRLLSVPAGLPVEGTSVGLGGTVRALADDVRGNRLPFEPHLLYDNDIWRYLWGGHVVAEGANPYLVAPEEVPDDAALDARLLGEERWQDIHSLVGFPAYKTIYPPGTLYFFAALAIVAPGSVVAAKLALIAVDLLLCVLIWRVLAACGKRPESVLVYAWNPAVVKEFAASAHPDVLMMLPLVAVPFLVWRGARGAAGGALAVSALAKVASLAAVPLVSLWSWRHAPERHYGWASRIGLPAALALVLAAGIWPLVRGVRQWVEALAVFRDRWTFNSGPWQAVRWLAETVGVDNPGRAARLICAGATLLLVAAIAVYFSRERPGARWQRRLTDFYSGLFLTMASVVLLSPAVMPWYVLWALPAAVLAGNRVWPVFTGLAFLSYLNYADGVGTLWWKWVEYGLFALVVFWSLTSRPRELDRVR